MARVKSATFKGAMPGEVDVHAPTYTRVIKNAIGDLALAYDKITGSNSEAEITNHDGTVGRGCPLGVPWVNQSFGGRTESSRAGMWGIDLTYTSATTKGSDASFGDTAIFAVPVFIPPGERDITIKIAGRGLDIWPWRVELWKESDGSVIFSGELRHSVNARYETLGLSSGNNGTSGAGLLCLLLVYADTSARQVTSGDTPDSQTFVYSLFAGPTRIRRAPSARAQMAGMMPTRRSTDDYTAAGGSLDSIWRDFDSTLFVDEMPMHAYLTGGANRNRNSLAEYITGWPAGGNASYTRADSGSNEPSRSEFASHSRSTTGGFTTIEPEVAWPLVASAFGAFQLAGNVVVNATPPTIGLLDWYAPMPMVAAINTPAALYNLRCEVPHFKSSASKLKVCVLAGFGTAATTEAVKWKSSVKMGTATASTAVAFAQVASTKLLTSKQTAIAFNADLIAEAASIRLEKTAAKSTFDEIVILGACLYFEP